MDAFRASVSSILDGTAPAPVLIPAVEPARPDAKPPRPTLRRGDTGEHVRELQRKLGVEAIGTFGPKTEAALRLFQKGLGMVPDGIVGPKTWRALDERS
jgi:peptidoglycan hydrolase-like protein with peptidoglycan-binding domain